MGNTKSNVTSGVKKQADTSSYTLYNLVDLKGGGVLVEQMKKAIKTKNYQDLEDMIKREVTPYLYNGGKGRMVPIQELVMLRNVDRQPNKQLQYSVRAPEVGLDEVDCDNSRPDSAYQVCKYRKCCWQLEKLGAVGESILHLCLLNATSVHAELAKRLIRAYPCLINDIYTSDEYYGESVLHMAIVNEDPAMVKFLLDHNCHYHERCCGNFMTPEDQKESRTDSFETEWVSLSINTNYEGYVYWGEYPLSFAACLGQEECYRLILARGADPNLQDFNGNTVLHLLIIYEKIGTFNMAYELGAMLNIFNHQHLTPLTLAAILAKKEMFFHVLKLEREIYWQIGSVTCAAYPLTLIDSIDNETGDVSRKSALNLIAFGDKEAHLDLMEGVIIDLLNAKWNSFVRRRFNRQLTVFSVYFIISLFSFILRPYTGPDLSGKKARPRSFYYGNNNMTTPYPFLTTTSSSDSEVVTIRSFDTLGSITFESEFGEVAQDDNFNFTSPAVYDATDVVPTGHREERDVEEEDRNIFRNAVAWLIRKKRGLFSSSNGTNAAVQGKGGKNATFDASGREKCILLRYDTPQTFARWIFDILLLAGAVLYLLGALREANFLGVSMFYENLMTVPSRVLFLTGCILVVVMAPLRFSCASEAEDTVAVFAMLCISPYFLFFCRGFKSVGPFVVMIYTMIMGDLLRFCTIYAVFIGGFSQAYYIIFLSYKKQEIPPGEDEDSYKNPCIKDNPIPNLVEGIMTMFVMSLNRFGEIYHSFQCTDHELLAKFMFMMYMAIVTILLVNMLIAMMGNTYQRIAETKNEWQRQWARIVLVVERGVHPRERLIQQRKYSQPMSDGRRSLVLRHQQTEEEKEELEELKEIRIRHQKAVKRRMKNKSVFGSGVHTPAHHHGTAGSTTTLR